MQYLFDYPKIMMEWLAILYNIILLLFAANQKSQNAKSGKIFVLMGCTLTCLTLCEVYAPWFYALPAGYHLLKMIVDSLQFYFSLSSEVLFAKYVESMFSYRPKQWVVRLNSVILIFAILVIAGNPWTGLVDMYNETTRSFDNGSLYIAAGYLPSGYFSLYTLMLYFKHWKVMDIWERFALGVSLFLIICGAVFQPLMHGRLKIIGLFATASYFVLFLALESRNYQELSKTREKMEEARAEAQAAEKAKNIFLANMSHELRTPMNAILGMNDLVLQENKESAILTYARDIKSAGEGLLTIINDVLDISRIEAGKMELYIVGYSRDRLVEDMRNLMAERARDSGLQCTVSVGREVPEILYGDEQRVREILTRLLDNAFKFTEEGRVQLSILIANKELIFKVEDSGRGIPKEDMPDIFESFKRADIGNNRSIEGAGLGLTIVKSITALMDGQVEVSSEQGKGTCFTVRLPLLEEKDQNGLNRAIPEGTDRKDLPDLSGKRIFIVDDNRMNLKVAEKLLAKTGGLIFTEESSIKAVQYMMMERYDMIFLDHMMPELNGLEVFHKIRNGNGPNCKTGIIIMTANDSPEDERKYLEMGFDGYVAKPVKPEKLARALWGLETVQHKG